MWTEIWYILGKECKGDTQIYVSNGHCRHCEQNMRTDPPLSRWNKNDDGGTDTTTDNQESIFRLRFQHPEQTTRDRYDPHQPASDN